MLLTAVSLSWILRGLVLSGPIVANGTSATIHVVQAQFGAESALAFDRAERGIDVTISNTTGELGLKAVNGGSLMIDNSPGLSLSGTMAFRSGGVRVAERFSMDCSYL